MILGPRRVFGACPKIMVFPKNVTPTPKKIENPFLRKVFLNHLKTFRKNRIESEFSISCQIFLKKKNFRAKNLLLHAKTFAQVAQRMRTTICARDILCASHFVLLIYHFLECAMRILSGLEIKNCAQSERAFRVIDGIIYILLIRTKF